MRATSANSGVTVTTFPSSRETSKGTGPYAVGSTTVSRASRARCQADHRTPMVVVSSKRMRETARTPSGAQSAVTTTPGRLRFMTTGVRKTSTAPPPRSRSIKGS